MLPPFATESNAAELGINVTTQNLYRASSRIRTYLRSVGRSVLIETPSDDLIELTCQIAARLGAVSQPMQEGVQQQTAGPFTQGFGWDAWKALAGLSTGERQTLRMMFPAMPRTISLGSASGPNPEPDDES